jgi:arginine-tRNA-protein transferase
MTRPQELPWETIQFYATSPFPCSYLPGRMARSQVATPSERVHTEVYSDLIAQGFRRSGSFAYRPHCDHCDACISVRLDTRHFQPSRSQRRIQRRLAHLQTRTLMPSFSEAHYALYLKYQRARHSAGGMDEDAPDQYRQYLLASRVNTRLVEFWQARADGPPDLLMVSIIDVVRDGLSAVYTFFDPDSTSSLGSYNILWQVDKARALGLSHVYLGYWIEHSPKMAYKSRFTPQERLIDGRWVVWD